MRAASVRARIDNTEHDKCVTSETNFISEKSQMVLRLTDRGGGKTSIERKRRV